MPILVPKMLYVLNVMVLPDVLALNHTLVILTQLDVDQNVFTTVNVLPNWLVSNNIAVILV